jgi:hypothetical protein
VLTGHDSVINALAVTRAHDSVRGGTQLASGSGDVRLWTLGGSAQQPPPDVCLAEGALIARFNEATANGAVGPEPNAFNLWEAVKAVFNPSAADAAQPDDAEDDVSVDDNDDDDASEDGVAAELTSRRAASAAMANDAAIKAHAYAELTTAYPSSVSMFASPCVQPVSLQERGRRKRTARQRPRGPVSQEYQSLRALEQNELSGGARMSLDDTWAAVEQKLSEFSKDMKGELQALFTKLDQHEMNPLKELKDKVTHTLTHSPPLLNPPCSHFHFLFSFIQLCRLHIQSMHTSACHHKSLIVNVGDQGTLHLICVCVCVHIYSHTSVRLPTNRTHRLTTGANMEVQHAPPPRSQHAGLDRKHR